MKQSELQSPTAPSAEPPVATRPLCRIVAEIDARPHVIGAGPLGTRMVAPVIGGRVEGERLSGKVLPGGGDWARIGSDDALRVDARLTIEAEGDAFIHVAYPGIIRPVSEMRRIRAGGEIDPDEVRRRLYIRTTPTFETGHARYAWLNDIVTVAVGTLTATSIVYDVHEVL